MTLLAAVTNVTTLQEQIPGNRESSLHAILSLVLVLLLAFATYHQLKNRFCGFLAQHQDLLAKEELIDISFFIALLIATGGVVIATNNLNLPEKISFWRTAFIQLGSQLLILLIIIKTIEPILKAWQTSQIELFNRDGGTKHGEKLEKKLDNLRRHAKIFLRLVLVFSPSLILLALRGITPNTILFSLILVPGLAIGAGFAYISRAKTEISKAVARKNRYGVVISDSATRTADPDRKDRETIAALFIELFRYDLGAPANSPGKFNLLEEQTGSAAVQYELAVRVDGDWKTRRMTIGRLGGESGSRSKCYFVIFNEYLVIKIPARKIISADDYLRILKNERRIVKQINMAECIVPTVSVILKNIKEIKDASGMMQIQDEEDYFRIFSLSQQLQRYFKINGESFVFIMDLSQYFFLQNAVMAMHNIRQSLVDELTKQADIAWDITEFECRYGIEVVALLITIKNAYQQFESRCVAHLQQLNLSSSFSSFHIKQWFFDGLAENERNIGKSLPPVATIGICVILEETLMANLATVIAYRDLVRNAIYTAEFYRNKAAMEGITSNLLKLLAYLKKVGVAMRDLKPENLLVAGDRDDYPGFLAYPEKYKIGLIDVETAVIFAQNGSSAIQQPQLGGTPHYATPSHFFRNNILAEVFSDLPTIFHMQDWYATIAIIYKIITGQALFEQTVHIIPAIIDAIKNSSRNKKNLAVTLTEVSSIFWRQARVEFEGKLVHKKELLLAATIDIPPSGRALFAEQLRASAEVVKKKITSQVTTQTFWPDTATRQHLLSCTPARIKKYKSDLRSGPGNNAAQQQRRQEFLIFFKKLEKLKLTLLDYHKVFNLLKEPEPRLSAAQLLTVMFQIVYHHLYQEEWEEQGNAERYTLTPASAHALSATHDSSEQQGDTTGDSQELP